MSVFIVWVDGVRNVGLALLYGTLLAGTTWLLSKTLLKRCRSSWLAAMWLVVLLRFAIPPLLPGSVTFAGLLNAPMGTATTALGLFDVLIAGADVPREDRQESSVQMPAAATGSSGVARTQEPSAWGWWAFPASAYLVGLVVVTCRWWVQKRRLTRWVRLQLPAGDALQSRVETLRQRLGCRRRPEVRVTDEAISPFVTGLLRPVLVLPGGVLDRASPEAADAVILHELAHLRRGDGLVRGLENLLRTVFFFWPPVGWACRQLEWYSELACDQLALRASRASAAAYAECLLGVVKESFSRRPVVSSAVAFARDGRFLEERFNMILQETQRASRARWLMAPVLVAWAGFALAGGAVRAQDKKEGELSEGAAPQRPVAWGQIDLDQPVPEERAKALREQYGEEGIDANGDGTLTRREVFEFYRKKGLPMPGRPGEGGPGGGPGRFGPGRPGPDGPFQMLYIFERLLRIESGKIVPERLLNTFPRADRNRDGQLSDEEFAVALNAAKKMAMERLFEVQPQADADKDGTISDEEFGVFKEATLVRLADRVFPTQPEADKDRDGKFSEEEFLAWREAQAARQREEMLKRHPGADTDGDGKLSEEEFRVASEKHRGAFMRGPGGPGGPPPRRPGMQGPPPGRPLPGETRPEPVDAPPGGPEKSKP